MYPLVLFSGNRFNANFYYFSKTDLRNCFLVINKKKKTLITNTMDYQYGRKAFRGHVVCTNDPLEEIKKLVGKKCCVDGRGLPASLYIKLRKIGTVKDVSNKLLMLRAKKTEDEIDVIKKATRETKRIIDRLNEQDFERESDVERFVRVASAERGLELAFDPMVCTYGDSYFPHTTPTKRKIKKLMLIDVGVRYNHYCADITRTFFFSFPEAERVYQTIQEIFYSVLDEVPSFANASELASFANKLLNKHKIKMPHAIGHGIGLDVHEYPILKEKEKCPLKGTVFTLEPAFYGKHYGVRFEEMVYFNGRSARVL